MEGIGRRQLKENLGMLENFELIKGKFQAQHYFEMDGYKDVLSAMMREFEIPSYLRHYDISAQIVNTLSGEAQKRPDNFTVRAMDENSTNEYERTKTAMLWDHVSGNIRAELDQILMDRGVLPMQEGLSEEEQGQYMEQVDQMRQQMTPPQIEEFMGTKFNLAAEIWGEYQLQHDRERYRFDELDKIEFEDTIIGAKCFRHMYIRGGKLYHENWNPVQVFHHQSSDVRYTEEGDYVGRQSYMTISDIIDKFGHRMTRDQLESLEEYSVSSWDNKKTSPEGIPYGTMIPYEGYQDHKLLSDALGTDPWEPLPGEALDHALRNNIQGSGSMYEIDHHGKFMVTECYWMSQQRIGKLCYPDPQTGMMVKVLVDETVVLPDWIEEVSEPIGSKHLEDRPWTIVWTYVNEVREGVKINGEHTSIGLKGSVNGAIYLGGDPLDFQWCNETNPYDRKLPVCGLIANNRNFKPTSLIDLIKPFQIFYNVAMNQLYQVMELNTGKFLIFDAGLFPNQKDWGGAEAAMEKFMLLAKTAGITVADTRPINTLGSSPNSKLPMEVDLDQSTRMMGLMNIAMQLEMMAHKQVGVTPERKGDIAASTTATGVQQSTTTSYAQTESWFTEFSNYKRRYYKMDLDAQMFLQKNNDDVSVMITKSDMTRSFIKISGSDLIADLGVYISKSQEELRQLDMMRQFALTNNTAGMTMLDALDVITMNSPAEIRKRVERSTKEFKEMENRKVTAQEDATAAMIQDKKEEREWQSKENELDRQSEERQEYMRTYGNMANKMVDADMNSIPDIVEYDRMALDAQMNQGKMGVEQRKIDQKERELQLKNEQERAKLADNEKQRQNDMAIAKENRNAAEIKAASSKKSTKKPSSSKKK